MCPDLYASQLNDCLGFQLTAEHPGLEFVSALPGALDPGIGIASHPGAITMSWSTAIPVSFDSDEILFTLNFIATKTGVLKDLLSLGSGITEAEVYLEKDGLIEIHELAISVNESTDREVFKLFQNTPNPFSDHTIVGFTLPEAGITTLTLFDIHGRVVYRMDKEAAAGYNEVALQRNTFKAPGVWYYRLDAGEFSATRKCVVVK
jgi:hypothetical protein